MTWMLFALAAYFIFAAVTITDKYLLGTPASNKEAPIPDARVYVFYIGVLGLSAFLLAPFGFEVPSGLFIFLNIFAGFLFILALLLFFFALRLGEVSRVGISVAGLIPLFTLLFIYISNGNIPTPLQLLAFGLLVGGSIVITFEGFENIIDSARKFTIVLFSAVLFGAYFTLVKFLFDFLNPKLSGSDPDSFVIGSNLKNIAFSFFAIFFISYTEGKVGLPAEYM